MVCCLSISHCIFQINQKGAAIFFRCSSLNSCMGPSFN